MPLLATVDAIGSGRVSHAQRSEAEQAAYELGSRLGSFVGERILWILGALLVLYLFQQLLRHIRR